MITFPYVRRRRLLSPAARSVLAGVLGLLIVATVAAQPRTAGAPDDIRPAFATSTDIAEGKRVSAPCEACHGPAGVSATDGVPHLAGQRPSYLYNKMRAYQSNARADRAMRDAVRFLNDDALVKLAAYYASLEPPRPTGTASGKARASVDPLAAGKAAAAACAGCHGETGVTATAGAPNLTGFGEAYFTAAMDAYKRGARGHDMMTMVAAATSEADVRHLALFYALQKPAAARTPSSGNAERGRTASAACAGCHGENGVSGDPANPSLAGQDAQYFVTAMRAYRDGTRADETMKRAATGMSDGAIDDLAAWYAAQTPRAPKVVKPLTLAEWAQRCDRCHGVDGNSTDLRTPVIASQRVDYLQKAIKAYQANERRSSAMAAMSAPLTDADVAGLAGHYAGQKARSVVFVALPGR